jgi:hypothetical protein
MNAAADEPEDASDQGGGADAAAEAAPGMRFGVSFDIEPLHDVGDSLPRMLGDSLHELLGMFYSQTVGKKANVVVTELVQNVLENVIDPRSALHLELRVDGDALVVRVSNKATPEQYASVRERVAALSDAEDVRKLFTSTLRARRADRLKGGLGLMRLVSENRFRLSVSYDRDVLTMQAAFPLRGSV